jgi:kynureninase
MFPHQHRRKCSKSPQIEVITVIHNIINLFERLSTACRYTKDALGLSFKLLEINPEAYTAWNYRKLAFQHNLSELSEPESIKSAVDDELRVVSL